MQAKERIVNAIVRWFFQLICRIDVQAFRAVPANGPLILVCNHVSFLEAPILMTHLRPRPVTGIAKRENWDNALFNFLFTMWKIIPIDRGMVDREAFRMSYEALEEGKILAIAPEGTRSKNAQLQQGKPGVVALVLRSGAPIMPMAFYGHENFWHNIKRLRRTEFHVVVGKPFRIERAADAAARDGRQVATDEIMYKIAELLPEAYRGYYHDPDKVDYQFVVDA